MAATWQRGFCAHTDGLQGAATCGTSGVDKGSWRAARAEQCLRKCEACDACVFVSFDPGDRDCSWYRHCKLGKLKVLRNTWHHTLTVRSGGAIVRPRPLPALPPFPSHLPEDGTQGYTPYFYKMDEPVRVRRTISYGRGWQLLRSRGAGNEDEGPCDPPQLAGSCSCSEATTPPSSSISDADDPMPRCVASAACGGASASAAASTATVSSAAGGVALVLVLDVTKDDVRFPFGGSVAKAYAFQFRYVVRLALSLRRVNNSLPVRPAAATPVRSSHHPAVPHHAPRGGAHMAAGALARPTTRHAHRCTCCPRASATKQPRPHWRPSG